jgi:hypothetical protein
MQKGDLQDLGINDEDEGGEIPRVSTQATGQIGIIFSGIGNIYRRSMLGVMRKIISLSIALNTITEVLMGTANRHIRRQLIICLELRKDVYGLNI